MNQIKVLTVKVYGGFVPQRFLDGDDHDIVILRDEEGRLLVMLTNAFYKVLNHLCGDVIVDLNPRIGCFVQKADLEAQFTSFEKRGVEIIVHEVESLQ